MTPRHPILAVLGIGVDLVETARMRNALARWGARLRNRIFAPEEQAYCEGRPEPWRHYAGRFAVKEAVGKALGTGLGEYARWRDIVVIRRADTGAPTVRLEGRAGERARRQGVRKVLASLAHTRDFAVAQALVLGEPEMHRDEP